MDGAGVELEGPVAVGDRIELEVPLGTGKAPVIQLQGDVRHMSDNDGRPRAGLEFVDVGALERALLFRLLRDLSEATPQSA
jgi:hypothetical protein